VIDRTLPLIVLLPAVLLLIQGSGCLRRGRAPFVRWFGGLAVAVAALDIVLGLLLLTGTLVPSQEFASVMVKGTPARLGLGVLLAGLAGIAALGWHIAWLAAGQVSRLRWLMLVALLMSVSAVWQVEILNDNDPPHARVYAYNVLWPPLLLWLGFAFFETCYTILRLRSRLWRAWAHAALVVAPAVWALELSPVIAEKVQFAWWVCLVGALPLGTGLGVWLAVGCLSSGQPRFRYRLTLSLVAAAIGLGFGLGWYPLSDGAWSMARWIVWPGVPLVVAGLGLRRRWTIPAGAPVPHGPPLRSRQVLSLAALVVVAASFTELVYFAFVGPLVPLLLFMAAWSLQAEATTSSLLTKLGELARLGQLWAPHSPLRQWKAVVAGWARTAWTRVGEVGKNLVPQQSRAVVAAEAAVALLGLIVLIELPNAGRTIVEPFTSQVKEEGQRIADRVLNEVAYIHQKLRPDAVRLLPRGAETEPAFKLVPASASGADAAFAKGSDIDLGYIKVPASFLLAISRDPVRALLGGRVITGTVHTGPAGHHLLARSSTGESWRIELSPLDRGVPRDFINEIAEQLAFEIVTGTDPTMRLAGLTHSWNAYEHFRKGLEQWNAFETGERAEHLAGAIASFREATRSHPRFALAFYRLGLALQRDGQPWAAEEALRTSLAIRENLIAATLALASTLYDHDRYLAVLSVPAATVTPRSASRQEDKSPEKKARRAEARRLWLDVIERAPGTVSPADRGAAFYGVCRSVVDEEKFEKEADADRIRLAYYYCRRAEDLYVMLPRAERESGPIREATASVLNTLERVFTRPFDTEALPPDGAWHCRDVMRGGPFKQTALRYLERAEALAPLNESIRCRAASLAYSLGRTERMKALGVEASAHLRLAEVLARRAKRKADAKEQLEDYRRALTEYREAIKLSPTMLRALNGFGQTLWEWRLIAPEAAEGAKFAREGETYARRALELAREYEDQIVAHGTLGKLLLTQARPLEAMHHLEAAHAAAPNHQRWNEIRWGLAQAYLCASANDLAIEQPEGEAVRWQHALPLFDKISELERRRESRPFSNAPQTLDPAEHRMCLRNPTAIVDRQPSPGTPRYVLEGEKPLYGPHRLCDRAAVSVDVPELKDDDRLVLHVWGGGLSRDLPVTPRSNQTVQLHSPPRATRHYYFAQLYLAREESKGAEPVSEVFPLRTHAEEEGRCTRNLIRLVFTLAR
jgi:tetratricopeptide (TPR) repeat protein